MIFPFLAFFFFQAEDGIRDYKVTGVQTCALPICTRSSSSREYLHRVADQDHLIVRAKAMVHRVLIEGGRDRKSTRLNSSHLVISYAVFCLRKKKNKKTREIL